METTDTLTPEQATALIRDVARTMTPSQPKPVTLAKRLEPFRQALLEQRAAGFTNKELVTMLASPSINLKVSGTLVRKVLNRSASAKKRTKKERPLNLEAPMARPKA